MVLPKIRTKQHGIGLLELLLSLAIVAVLIVISARYFESVRFSQQAAAAHAQFIEIAQALNHYRQIYGNFTPASAKAASLCTIKQWLSPAMAKKVNDTQSNVCSAPSPFGGATRFEVLNATAATVLIRIAIGAVNRPLCEKISAAIADTACPGGNAVDFYYPKKPK